ncbi:MAG: ABC transporter permease [Hyphomicrobiales bacterium]
MTPEGMGRVVLWVWTLLVAIFILTPLIVLAAISVTPEDYISLPIRGVSLRWYADMLRHPNFLDAARNSLLLAVEAAATALAAGTLLAIAVTRFRFPGRGLVTLIASAPLFIPLVMSGLAIRIFFSTFAFDTPALRLYAAHVALTVPFVVRLVSASLAGFDWNQEAAARNLGASPARAFAEITLPQIAQGVIAGGIFALIVSFDDVGMSIFLTGADYTTLPIELFAAASYELTPTVAAISVAMILFSALSVLVIERWFGVQKMFGGELGSEDTRQPAGRLTGRRCHFTHVSQVQRRGPG